MRWVEHIAVVGCGGIGSWLLPPLLRFLNAEGFTGTITLWDGDRYSRSNLLRQDASDGHVGWPKAEAQAERFRAEFPGLLLRHRAEYVSPENVQEAVVERALVFSCVDNHPARAVLATRADALRDVCVLSAGNERLDGNVHVTLRRGGKALTAPLLERHPEIGKSSRGDRNAMGCEELIEQGETQLLVTNVMAATALLGAFHALWTHGQARRVRGPVPQEIYFDAAQCGMSAVPAVGL